MNRFRSLIAFTIAFATFFSVPVKAQSAADFPSKPIRIVVPFTAGGPADSVTRFVGQWLADTWKQSVVVENRPGAGGMIGADLVAKAPPDGYTLVLLVTGHTILPAMRTKPPYDVTRDFSPITIFIRAPKVVVVNPTVPAKSLRELIDLQKREPAKYSAYGTSGVASMANLSMEQVNQLAGTQFQHVAYKGGAATITDLLGGQLPFGVLDMGSVLPQVNAGKLRVLAITSKNRASILPDVPTISETLGTFEAAEWFGLVAPRGVPREIITKLEQEIRRALLSPAAKSKYADPLGWEMVASTPEEMELVIDSQTRKWGELVRTLGLKLD